MTSFSQSPHPPAYACYLAGIPIRVGQSKEFGGGLLSHWVKPLTDRSHQVERSLHLLRSCGIPADDPRLELQVQAEHQAGADSILAEAGIRAGDAFLALAPGASAQSRRYPEERFAQAAAMLVEQAGLPLVLLGSQREAGRFPLLEALAVRHPGVASLVGKTSVPEMAGVIQRCALLLGNNSGPMHLAGALNRPAVILFSGTEWIEQWAPVSGQMHLLNRATFCQPCHTFQCPYSLECLDIPAGEVVARAMQLLAHRTLPAPARFQDTIRR